MKTPAELIEWLDVVARVSSPTITCERAAELAETLRDLYGQHQVDIAEMVSWKIHAQALNERDEARRELAELRQLLKGTQEAHTACAIGLKAEREAHEKTKQEACGFAWDVGAEMSRNDGYCMRRPDGTIECRRFVCHQPCAARPGAVSDVEVDASDYERPANKDR